MIHDSSDRCVCRASAEVVNDTEHVMYSFGYLMFECQMQTNKK